MTPWSDGLHSCSACGELTWSSGDLCYDCADQSKALQCGEVSPAWLDRILVALGVVCAVAVVLVLGCWFHRCLLFWFGAPK